MLKLLKVFLAAASAGAGTSNAAGVYNKKKSWILLRLALIDNFKESGGLRILLLKRALLLGGGIIISLTLIFLT